MKKLIMLEGLPASGKSTWAEGYKNIMEETEVVIVSSDKIREALFGDINDQSHNPEVFAEMLKRTRAAFNNFDDVIVIYDATNLSRKKRVRFLKNFKDMDIIKEIKVFAVPFETCKNRNNSRERVVPDSVMERMLRSFEPPHPDEGWDSIELVGYNSNISAREVILQTMRETNMKCPHDNPHHLLTCGRHCERTAEIMEEYIKRKAFKDYEKEDMINAARYHDIAKFYVKAFKNTKGELTDIAHYYCHENVSAYFYMTYRAGAIEDKRIITTINMIANHMVFFNQGSKQARKEYYSKKFWRKIKILHWCDIRARGEDYKIY